MSTPKFDRHALDGRLQCEHCGTAATNETPIILSPQDGSTTCGACTPDPGLKAAIAALSARQLAKHGPTLTPARSTREH